MFSVNFLLLACRSFGQPTVVESSFHLHFFIRLTNEGTNEVSLESVRVGIEAEFHIVRFCSFSRFVCLLWVGRSFARVSVQCHSLHLCARLQTEGLHWVSSNYYSCSVRPLHRTSTSDSTHAMEKYNLQAGSVSLLASPCPSFRPPELFCPPGPLPRP